MRLEVLRGKDDQYYFGDVEMNDPVKQVIVMRVKYPDGNGGTTGLRKGKMIAQGCHASLSFLTAKWGKKLTKDEQEWIDSGFAKICVSVDSEEELLDIFQQAKDRMLTVHMITDSGKTEFDGVPTKTCLAIGPDRSSKINPVTGELKLL